MSVLDNSATFSASMEVAKGKSKGVVPQEVDGCAALHFYAVNQGLPPDTDLQNVHIFSNKPSPNYILFSITIILPLP